MPNGLVVVSNLFYHPDIEANEMNTFMTNSAICLDAECTTWNTEIKGNKPKIFIYQFIPVDGFGAQSLAMCFYENIYVYAYF